MSDKHTAEFYVEFRASTWGGYSSNNIREVRAIKLTQKKPQGSPGNVIVKFTTTIPDQAFLRSIPEASIEVPLDFTESVAAESTSIEVTPVEVEEVADVEGVAR